MGTITFRVTFEDETQGTFPNLEAAVFAIRECAQKLKLTGEERHLYYDATVVEQVAEMPSASHSHVIDWQTVDRGMFGSASPVADSSAVGSAE